MSRICYRVYPSLLDKFQSYLDSDIEAESFWNIDSETGEMKKSPDEITAANEQALLDAINRVPHEPIEAADKGTCFNEIVDCLVEHRESSRKEVSISRIPDLYDVCDRFCGKRNCDYKWNPKIQECISAYENASRNKVKTAGILATLNGFEFRFDIGLCREAAAYFKDAVPQHLCKAVISTAYGDVELYGYADEIVRDKVFDIKTTSSYQFGKFERAWQKFVYPWCLVESGEMHEVSSFEYTVFVLSKPTSKSPFITGKMYREEYTYDHEQAGIQLRSILERFIEWLEAHREEITDRKIFGGEDVPDKQRPEGLDNPDAENCPEDGGKSVDNGQQEETCGHPHPGAE